MGQQLLQFCPVWNVVNLLRKKNSIGFAQKNHSVIAAITAWNWLDQVQGRLRSTSSSIEEVVFCKSTFSKRHLKRFSQNYFLGGIVHSMLVRSITQTNYYSKKYVLKAHTLCMCGEIGRGSFRILEIFEKHLQLLNRLFYSKKLLQWPSFKLKVQ